MVTTLMWDLKQMSLSGYHGRPVGGLELRAGTDEDAKGPIKCIRAMVKKGINAPPVEDFASKQMHCESSQANLG